MFRFIQRSLIHTIWTVFLSELLFTDLATAGQCCDGSTGLNDLDTEWTLVTEYANIGTPQYGDNTTTHCQCRQACLDLPNCTSYDWYPKGTPKGIKCWIGSNCPVNLTHDVQNQHYIRNSKLSCYPNISDKEVGWTMVKDYADIGTPSYGDNTTTHCQCRQACLDLPNCTNYDWYPKGTPKGIRCWIGAHCPVSLKPDSNNQHYILNSKLSCYPSNLIGSANSMLHNSNIVLYISILGALLISY